MQHSASVRGRATTNIEVLHCQHYASHVIRNLQDAYTYLKVRLILGLLAAIGVDVHVPMEIASISRHLRLPTSFAKACQQLLCGEAVERLQEPCRGLAPLLVQRPGAVMLMLRRKCMLALSS
jgi:hypothetical protein